ncbi:thiamine diphosphokinase [Staphylococcus massiliensis]|uniref:Thiamine diphosphokinase n=1 Tax=Staphylococcus massiliensis S46 TaxID=1229783 RepID=K9B9M3_9STAP|nr:thiamine diphosphokinase [Staphylococcus massiliensis]EKU50425.1 thiamin pyrophosphokinase [Staphylococcus massiliensis S46]MCG3411852.1 thiamine diphosphokinase [Staphylococcus massiliensis]POA00500.1 thiamine diphosphokinase [Staphylococcus massiliensis CCUG 55927]
MHINLLCGLRHLPNHFFEKHSQETFAGVDRGAFELTKRGIEPLFMIGDFDSVTDDERQELIETYGIEPLKPEKDDTDLALAVDEAVKRGYKHINVYGATGGRLDHFMGALQILEKPYYINVGIHIRLIDSQNEIQLINEGKHQIERLDAYPYVSFIPLRPNAVISLEGFKYGLNHEVLEEGSTLTISNEVEDDVGYITVERGMFLQMRSSDKPS